MGEAQWKSVYFCLHGQELSWYATQQRYQMLSCDTGVFMSAQLVAGRAAVHACTHLRDPRTPSQNGLLLSSRPAFPGTG